MELSWILFNTLEKKSFQDTLSKICKHTGDVLRVIAYIYKRNHYHFKTSQKRMFVQVLERYSPADLETNLMLSWKKREENIKVLQGIDYQNYSRSLPHMNAVKKLRNKELRSWNGQVDGMLKIKDENAVSFIGQRPGMLLRMIAWLMRLGYDKESIKKELMIHHTDLSMPTLITVLTYFGGHEEREEAEGIYEVLSEVLFEKMKYLKTPLQNKKVYVDEGNFSMIDSIVECSSKSDEGGYIRSGLAIKIPENVKRLRFFVYWNDKHRVDIDLHADASDKEGNVFHVGWYGEYHKNGIVTSGDITHSNAAEYIDIDMTKNVARVDAQIDIYDGKRSFKEIEECFVGMMAVNQLGEDVKLYNPKNCFFSHYLRSQLDYMNYGFIDVDKRLLVFGGKKRIEDLYSSKFNLKVYVDLLCLAQGAEKVSNKEDAEIILSVDKREEENSVSLLDNNFFVE